MHVTTGRVGRLVTSLAAVAALGVGLVSGPGTASAADSSRSMQLNGPHYQQPSVGQCRNYTWDAGLKDSNSSPVVSCSKTHTARVIAVPMLPAGMTWSASADSLERVMMKACYPKFEKALGRTAKIRHRSAYGIMWFIPTRTQRSHGARWIRCDIALRGGQQLRPIPKDTAPMLPAGSLPDRIARCLSGDQHLMTVCVKSHNYRATGATVVDRTRYPGSNTLFSIAKKRCPGLVNTRRYYATWPTKNSWRAGDHVIVCYSHTSN
ncbi:MAG TPA: septum formation family protein [Nocardioides sp.]|jgi:hypothetical protein